MQQPSKPCAHCGKVFFKKPFNSMKVWNEGVKYCSRSCYGQAKLKPPQKVCPQCGKAFKPKHWEGRAVFCSSECSSASQRKPLPICELCGKQCTKHGRRFCSPECKVTWYRGEQVYNYLGPECVDFYTSTFWYARSEEIRQRDKVCRHCGKTPEQNGKSLDVHHIIPRSVREDHSPENLIALCVSCHAKADAKLRKQNSN